MANGPKRPDDPELGDRGVAERRRLNQDARRLLETDDAEDYLDDLDFDLETPDPYHQH